MLPGGDLDHAEGAHDDAHDQHRAAALEEPDDEPDPAYEDADLRNREAAKRALGSLPLPAELTIPTADLARRAGPALGSLVASCGDDRAWRGIGAPALARATLGLLRGHGAVRIGFGED